MFIADNSARQCANHEQRALQGTHSKEYMMAVRNGTSFGTTPPSDYRAPSVRQLRASIAIAHKTTNFCPLHVHKMDDATRQSPLPGHSTATTATDLAGNLKNRVPSLLLSPENGVGETLLGASKVLCASIVGPERSLPRATPLTLVATSADRLG